MTMLQRRARSASTTGMPARGRTRISARRWDQLRQAGAVTATVALILGVWELLTVAFDFMPIVLRSPQQIFGAVAEDPFLFLRNAWTTLYEIVIGFVIAAALGIVLAIVIVWSRILQITVYPILLLLQIVPKVAVAPLLIVFLGFGVLPKIVIGVLLALFPILVNTAVGLRSADREIIDLVRVLNGSRLQEFTRVRFPNAALQR